jgi:hypothetical protein
MLRAWHRRFNLPMKDILFEIVKRDNHAIKQGEIFTYYHSHPYVSTHHYKFDEETEDLAEVATRLCNAERALAGNQVEFLRVLAIEAEEGKEFDASTLCHLCIHADHHGGQNTGYPSGYRRAQTFDRFIGLSLGRNRKSGRVTKQFYGGGVGASDLRTHKKKEGTSVHITLLEDAYLLFMYLPIFRQMMGDDAKFDTSATLDRWGRRTPKPEAIGEPVVCEVSNLSEARRAAFKSSVEEGRIRTELEGSFEKIQDAFWHLNDNMGRFDHTWGNANFPDWFLPLTLCQQAAQMWYPLARALGYEIPPAAIPWTVGHYQHGQFEQVVASGCLATKEAATAVDSCIQNLYQIDRYIAGVEPYSLLWHQFGNNAFETKQALADYLYENFDTFQDAMFSCASTLGILQSILLLRTVTEMEARPKARIVWQPPENLVRENRAEPLPPMNVDIFTEPIYQDREPYLTIEEPEEVAVYLPPSTPAPVPLYVPENPPVVSEPEPEHITDPFDPRWVFNEPEQMRWSRFFWEVARETGISAGELYLKELFRLRRGRDFWKEGKSPNHRWITKPPELPGQIEIPTIHFPLL